jgi:tRNA dimethylallyltransferase
MHKNTTLIAGPTASGKSALALQLAQECDGIIVNADSMQVYDVLRVLTARPSRTEMQGVPHFLFGHVNPARLYSTGMWLADVEELLRREDIAERPMIFVGGTGLYFQALLGGLSQMPDVAEDIRTFWRERLAAEGPEVLHGVLARRDPETAAWLKPQDGQRIVRAIEVFEASGKPISDWQKLPGVALVDPDTATRLCLLPDREVLRERIDRRFEGMVEAGALEEVRALKALALHPALPAMKAIGVGELSAFLDGDIELDAAIALASAATRQYAKRQTTWLRNRFKTGWELVPSENTAFQPFLHQH